MDDDERGPRLSKRFSDKNADGDVDYKTKAGTAWSHSFLNQKPWHPLSYPNQRRKWIAEQTHAQQEPRAEEVARESGFPSLLLAEKTEDDEFRELFLLSNESTRKIRLPEAYGKLCVSSRGLLATVGDDFVVKLVNPLSHKTVNLPSINTFPESLETLDWKKSIWKLLVPSIIPPLGIVVVVWGSSSKLGFCRPGDNKWTPVVNGWGGATLDITYYNNRVYSFDDNCYIRICDIYGDNPTVMVTVSRLPRDLYDDDNLGAYILGCDDDDGRRRLLVIIRETTFDDDEDDEHDDDDNDDDDYDNLIALVDEDEDELGENTSYMTEGFKVFGYDLESETWSKVKDLGRKTLFVGYNSSFWIQDTTGVIKGNCIYYTDDGLERGKDMGIYHMSDGTIESHYAGESLSKVTPPIWLQSI